MKSKHKLFTAKEICEILEVSNSHLSHKLLKCKPPLPRVREGRGFKYDLIQIYEWVCKDPEFAEYRKILFRKFPGLESDSETSEKNTSKSTETINYSDDDTDVSDYDIESIDRDMKAFIKNSFNIIKVDPSRVDGNFVTNLKAMTQQTINYEKAIRDRDKETNEVIPFNAVQILFSRVSMAISTDFLALPAKISGELCAISDPAEMKKVLSKHIDNTLRHLANVIIPNTDLTLEPDND